MIIVSRTTKLWCEGAPVTRSPLKCSLTAKAHIHTLPALIPVAALLLGLCERAKDFLNKGRRDHFLGSIAVKSDTSVHANEFL